MTNASSNSMNDMAISAVTLDEDFYPPAERRKDLLDSSEAERVSIAEEAEKLGVNPILYPPTIEDRPAHDIVKGAMFVRGKTGAFAVCPYVFRFPGVPYEDPRTGMPLENPRWPELIQNYRQSAGNIPAAPSLADSIGWYLSRCGDPRNDIRSVYDACQLSYEGEQDRFWYGYTDKRTGAFGYGFAPDRCLESLIAMAGAPRDADRLHELLIGSPLNRALIERFRFIDEPPQIFEPYSDRRS